MELTQNCFDPAVASVRPLRRLGWTEGASIIIVLFFFALVFGGGVLEEVRRFGPGGATLLVTGILFFGLVRLIRLWSPGLVEGFPAVQSVKIDVGKYSPEKNEMIEKLFWTRNYI